MNKIYQKITIKGSLEKFLTDSMEYPFQQLNITYIKLIVYKKLRGDNDIIIMKPISFLIVQPQDILSREYVWSQNQEDELIEASNIAIKQRIEYQKALEEEMTKKTTEIKNPKLDMDDDDEIIDPDFKTKFDPGDPSFG